MPRNISFNGINMQQSWLLTTEVDDANMPTKQLSVFAKGHANGSSIAYEQYPSRSITLKGTILGDNIVMLDDRIDYFKNLLRGWDKNLDMDYGESVRRYKATLSNLKMNRPNGLTHCDFEATFLCTNPFATPLFPVTLVGAAQKNLIINPSFEADLSGWSVFPSGTLTRDTTFFRSGIASAKFVSTGGANQGLIYELENLVPGATYIVSGYAKSPAATTVSLQADLFTVAPGDGGTYVQTYGTQVAGDSFFNRMQFTFTCPANATMANIFFFCAQATTFYVDDAQVELGTGAATPFSLAVDRTTASQVDNIEVIGTAPWQLPKCTIEIKAGTGLTGKTISWGNDANGQQITISRDFVVGDIILIDCATKNVYVNGALHDFSGAFPEFEPGIGKCAYSDSFTTRTIGYEVTYYPMYL